MKIIVGDTEEEIPDATVDEIEQAIKKLKVELKRLGEERVLIINCRKKIKLTFGDGIES